MLSEKVVARFFGFSRRLAAFPVAHFFKARFWQQLVASQFPRPKQTGLAELGSCLGKGNKLLLKACTLR